MKRWLLVMTMGLGLVSHVAAQTTWTFDNVLWDSNMPPSNGSGVHGVAVAPDGNVWIGSYNVANDTDFTSTDTTKIYPIYIVDGVTGAEVSFSPIKYLTFGTDVDSITNTNKGVSLDQNGNIMYGSFEYMYRINYMTGEGMNKLDTNPLSSVTEAAVDAAGNIFVGHVGSKKPLHMYDTDFTFVADVIDTVPTLQRSILVTADGKDIYMGTIWPGAGIFHYHSDAPGVVDFVLVDTVGPQLAVADTTSTGADTTIMKEIWASSLDWGADSTIWAGVLKNAFSGLGAQSSQYYQIDLATNTIIDTVGIAEGDSSAGGLLSPRGVAFSNDGKTMYLADFDYNLVGVWTKGYTGVNDDGSAVASGYSLSQNYPNPFNPVTTIGYSLPISEQVNISIYNLKGQLVTTLVNKVQNSGQYLIRWEGTDASGSKVASGIYLYRIKTANVTITKQMSLIK